MQDQNIVYIPPNFDINQIKEITGIKSDAHSKIGHYVGRSECGTKLTIFIFFYFMSNFKRQ